MRRFEKRVPSDELPRRVLVIDEQPDHFVLMREALESSEPPFEVIDETGSDPPSVIVVSLSTERKHAFEVLGRVESEVGSLPIVAVSDGEDRWSVSELGGSHTGLLLDKRAGLGFLGELPEVVQRAYRSAQLASRDKSRMEGVITDDDAEQNDASMSRMHEGSAILAGSLALTLSEVLRGLGPAGALVGERGAADPVLGKYLESLRKTVYRAEAVARRIANICGVSEGRFRRRRLRPEALPILRERVWREWAFDGPVLDVEGDDKAPAIDVSPSLMGTALDALVRQAIIDAGKHGRVLISIDRAIFDDQVARRHRGARSGRYALIRIVAWQEEGQDDAGEIRSAETSRPRETASELAMVAAKAHGGYVVTTSDPVPPMISKVEIFLPAARSRVSLGAAEQRKSSVLVVDDEQQIRKIAGGYLDAAGFDVDFAESGVAAVEKYRKGFRYDLVLLDMRMEPVGGLETYRRLLEVDPGIAVVITSGQVPRRDLEDALALGAFGFLPKPFRYDEITTMVEAALGSPSESDYD